MQVDIMLVGLMGQQHDPVDKNLTHVHRTP